MKKYVYGYYDTASELYLKTVYTADDPKSMMAGARSAARAAQIGHDTDDIELFLLAEWDNETGHYDSLDRPRKIFRYVDIANFADQFRSKEVNDAREENPIEEIQVGD